MQRRKEHVAFSISEDAKEEILRDILNINVSQACQDTDIPIFLPKSLRRNQASLSAFYTIGLKRLFLTRNFHQY